MLFSASTDKTVAVWDSETGERVKRLKGHTSFVNSCYPARRGPQLVCTGSDDGTVKVGVVCLYVVAGSEVPQCELTLLSIYGVAYCPQLCFSGHFPKQRSFCFYFKIF